MENRYPEYIYRRFPDLVGVVTVYQEEVERLPVVLSRKRVVKELNSIRYEVDLELLCPYSEWTVSTDGLYRMDFDAMYQQAMAYKSGKIIHGWLIKWEKEGQSIKSKIIFACIGDHEPLAGCMLRAGYREEDITDLYKYGLRIPFNKEDVDARVLLQVDADSEKKMVEYFPWGRSSTVLCDQGVKNLVNKKLGNFVEATHPEIARFLQENTNVDLRGKAPDYIRRGL